MSEAGGEVAVKCFEDLGLSYYSKEELARWKEELAGAGEPNHGLLGAWYLHRVGLNVLDRSEDIDGFRENQSEILRMAVRAVLCHGASTGQIRSTSIPWRPCSSSATKSSWDPGRHAAPAPSSIGRSFHVMAADVPAREPRDAWIEVRVYRCTPATPRKAISKHRYLWTRRRKPGLKSTSAFNRRSASTCPSCASGSSKRRVWAASWPLVMACVPRSSCAPAST